jgi:uncharacterized protein YecT (DUF1311 family)
MKNFLLATLLLAFTPSLGSAQNSKQYVACSQNAQTQVALNACAGQELQRADADLNKTYRALLAKTADQPGTVAKIKSAQKAWLVFRDAYLEAMFPAADKQTEYGSMYPLQHALLHTKLTRLQTVALKDLLRQHGK